MFKKSQATMRGRRHKRTTPATRYNIFQSESYYSNMYSFEREPVKDKSIISLKDYEAIDESRRNFLLVVNDIPTDQIGQTAKPERSSRTTISTRSFRSDRLEKPTVTKTYDVLDTVRSGESLIKHFTFDTSKYNGDTIKCIAFWKALMKTGIQPVKCTLIKPEKSCENLVKEQEDNSGSGKNSYMWYRALLELQKRKMDEAAFATSSNHCSLCKREEPYAQFKQKQNRTFSKDELRDTEDITCLNDWKPVKIEKKLTPKPPLHKSAEKAQVECPPCPHQPQDVAIKESEISDQSDLTDNLLHPSPAESEDTDCSVINNPQKKMEEENVYQVFTVFTTAGKEYNKARTNNTSNVADITAYTATLTTNDFGDANERLAAEPNKRSVEKDAPKELVKECTCGEEDCKCNQKEEPLVERILPECGICLQSCTCLEKKVNLSRKFLDDLKYEIRYKESRRDKSCQEGDEQIKDKRICIICGHDNCQCRGPTITRRRYLDSIQFDNQVIATLQEKKERLPKKSESRMWISKVKSMKKQILEENPCCKLQSINADCVEKRSTLLPKIGSTKKRLFVTPAQRAKQVASQKTHIFEIDKYGIPQVARYADGKLGPKRTTSEDISSSSAADESCNG